MQKFLSVLVLSILSLLGPMPQFALAKPASGGGYVVPFSYYGTVSSATTGATALIFLVPNLKASNTCTVTPTAYGTGPVSWTKAVVTAGTITLTVNANQTAGSTIINYLCFKP